MVPLSLCKNGRSGLAFLQVYFSVPVLGSGAYWLLSRAKRSPNSRKNLPIKRFVVFFVNLTDKLTLHCDWHGSYLVWRLFGITQPVVLPEGSEA